MRPLTVRALPPLGGQSAQEEDRIHGGDDEKLLHRCASITMVGRRCLMRGRLTGGDRTAFLSVGDLHAIATGTSCTNGR